MLADYDQAISAFISVIDAMDNSRRSKKLFKNCVHNLVLAAGLSTEGAKYFREVNEILGKHKLDKIAFTQDYDLVVIQKLAAFVKANMP